MSSNTQDNFNADRYGTNPLQTNEDGSPYLGQDTGIGGKISHSAEQAYSRVTGRAGDTNTTNSGTDNQCARSDSQDGAQPSLKDRVAEKAERAFGGNSDTTGFGTDNQYGRSDEGYPRGDNRSQEGTGVDSLKDKVVGKAERAFGGNTTTGFGTDNQYGRSDGVYTQGGNRNGEGTGVEPNLKDRVVGKAERAFGGNTTTGSGTDNQYTTNAGRDEGYQASNAGGKPNLKDQIVGKAEGVYGKAEQFVDNLKDKV